MSNWTPPIWLGTPSLDHTYSIELIDNGVSVTEQNIDKHNYYIIQRVGTEQHKNTIFIEHDTISRQHAVLLYHTDHTLHLYDCSTHGTLLNKQKTKQHEYVRLYAGDQLKFGLSNIICVIQSTHDETRPLSTIQHKNNDFENTLKRKLEQSRVDTVTHDVEHTTDNNDVSDELDNHTEQSNSALYLSDDATYALRPDVKITTAQQCSYDTYNNKRQKLQQCQHEIDILHNKQESQQGELSTGQQNALNAHTAKLEKLMTVLQQCEDNLLQVFSADTLRAQQYNDNSDDDDYFDRTKTQSVKQPPKHTITTDTVFDINKLHTVDQLQTAMKRLETQRNQLRNNLKDITIQQHTNNTANDTLDTYMQQVISDTYQQRKDHIKTELRTLQAQYIQCEDKLKVLQAQQRSAALLQQQITVSHQLTSKQDDGETPKLIAVTKQRQAERKATTINTESVSTTQPTPFDTAAQPEQNAVDELAESSFLAPSAFAKFKNNLGLANVKDKFEVQRLKYDISNTNNKRTKLQHAVTESIDNTEVNNDHNDNSDIDDTSLNANWVKPSNQDGTGRTALNDKYGY